MARPDYIDTLLANAGAPKVPSYLRPQHDEQTIEVNDIISKAAHLYEKIRYAVDYQEEHLLRRSAIERMLKRKLAMNLKKDEIARSLICELIRGNYIPNKSVPERITEDIQAIIDKHLTLVKRIDADGNSLPGQAPYWNTIMSLAATEIEQFMFPNPVEQSVVNALYSAIKTRVQLPEENDYTMNERHIQIYIACNRSLLKSDDPSLYHKLWMIYYPDWSGNVSRELIANIAEHFETVHESIKSHLQDSLSWQVNAKLKNYSIYFGIIKELLDAYGKNSGEVFSDKELLSEAITEHSEKKYREVNKRIKKSTIRAVIYIFLTKIILALVIELPYDLFIIKVNNYLPLIINVLFHPILLYLITRSIAIDTEKNTDHIIQGINTIVNGNDTKAIRITKRRYGFSILGVIVGLMYATLFGITFGSVIWVLGKLDFTVVSGLLFIFFLTLISYFGLRIRYNAKQFQVQTGVENPVSFFWDLVTLPIVKVGRWLTEKFSSINIFIFLLDFIIEAPFKLVLEVFEEFVIFLKEKKEEMY